MTTRKVIGTIKCRIEVYPESIAGAILDTGYTQKECAKVLGISPSYLSDIRYGRRISFKVLRAIEKMAKWPDGSLSKLEIIK